MTELSLPALCAGVAVLEADTVLVGQWMISRPIVVGPLFGWLCGQPWEGAVLGAIVELFSLESIPVGAVLPGNAAVAAGCAVLLTAGPSKVPAAVALPAALGFGLAHGWLESAVREWRATLTRAAERRLSAKRNIHWVRLNLKSIGAQVAATAAFVYLSVTLGGPALVWAWASGPEWARAAGQAGFYAAPLIGFSGLVNALARKA